MSHYGHSTFLRIKAKFAKKRSQPTHTTCNETQIFYMFNKKKATLLKIFTVQFELK